MPGSTTPKPSPITTSAGTAGGGGGPKRSTIHDESMVMSAPKGMQHVERSNLYTDVIYRVKFVAALVGFTKEDQLLVAELAPKIEPMLPDFIEAAYAQLFKFDVLAESFLNRMQGFDGQVVYKLDNLTINSEQITFRRSMLLKYFVRTMRAMSDFEALIPYLDWVAAIHSKQSYIPIEFIHCNGLLGFMSGKLIKLIAQLHLPQDKMLKAQAAITRMLWVQNDLFAMHAVADGQEFEDAHLASPLKTEPEKNNVMPPVYPEQKAKRRQSIGIPSIPSVTNGDSDSVSACDLNMTCLFSSLPGPAKAAHDSSSACVSGQSASNAPGPHGCRDEAADKATVAVSPAARQQNGWSGTASSTKSGHDSVVTVTAAATTTASETTATSLADLCKCPIDNGVRGAQASTGDSLSLTSTSSPLVVEGACPHRLVVSETAKKVENT